MMAKRSSWICSSIWIQSSLRLLTVCVAVARERMVLAMGNKNGVSRPVEMTSSVFTARSRNFAVLFKRIWDRGR
ncbi:hypothetical protein FB451DRAFT_1256204 [Mycena latifolia]|nr:hypothetical protein FB451DRAFT_1309889 [Mycena latifolia]KAJ7469256.1 hypothetical protein FB451DRAFT_1256204 [Mycena latifolia]